MPDRTTEPHHLVTTGQTRRILALLTMIVILAGLLRLAWLDGVPPGINQDEAVLAYDAYSLLKTGKDHGGASWPVFCYAWGARGGAAAPFIYLMIPFQALLGMTVWSTRLPAALMGTLAVPLVYLLVKRWYGVRAALWGAFLLAVSPWHVQLSRLAFEVSICPTLVVLGLLLFVRGVAHTQTESEGRLPGGTIFLALAGLVLGLALWTYNAMRVFVPLLLAGSLLLYWHRVRPFLRRPGGRLRGAAAVTGFCIGIAPFVWACVKTPEQIWGRAITQFVLSQTASAWDSVAAAARSYAYQVSPSFLFLTGDPSPIQGLPGYGELHLVCALFLALGLYRVIRRHRSEPIGRFLLWWLLIAPVPAALTKLDAGHSLRAAGALPAYQIVAAIGIDLLLTAAASSARRLYRPAMDAAVVLVAGSAAWFSYLFFKVYPVDAAPVFHAEWREVIGELKQREADYDLVLLTSERCGQIGTIYLFWSQTPPQEYFAMPQNIWHGPEWDVLLQAGKFFFVASSDLPQLAAQLPADVGQVRVLVAERPWISVPGKEIKRYYYPDGKPAISLYDVQVQLDRGR